jgi:NTP pyrophosphatase (non-canonical NTP hydrolase)
VIPKKQLDEPVLNLLQLELTAWQLAVSRWHDQAFGEADDTPCRAQLVLTEEVGELSRAIVKQSQGIRGTSEQWETEQEKEIGDVLISLAMVATRCGISLGAALEDRWRTVRQRTAASQKEERLPNG